MSLIGRHLQTTLHRSLSNSYIERVQYSDVGDDAAVAERLELPDLLGAEAVVTSEHEADRLWK